MVALIPSKKDSKGNWLCPVCGSPDIHEDAQDDGMALVMCDHCNWNVFGRGPIMKEWDEDWDEDHEDEGVME